MIFLGFSETAGRVLASSGFVSRGLSTSDHGLPDHPLPRKDPLSRGIANLRDGDLRLLGVLTRQALDGLD